MTTALQISQDPTAFEFYQNPYPFYDELRSAPFMYWQDYGFFVTARYDLVNMLLRDRRFGREAKSDFALPQPAHVKPFYDFEANSLLECEAPKHTRLRRLILQEFTSRRLQSFAPVIEAICDSLLDALPDEPFDFLPLFAEQLPVRVIAALIGVPEKDCPELLNWSHDMVAMYQANRDRNIEDKAVAATLAFSDYIAEIVEEKRRNPSDDLLSSLILAQDEGDALSLDELITTTILLLNAGHEATVHAIANGMKLFLEYDSFEHVDFLDATARDRAIEEVLRYEPPLHMFTRYVYEPCEIEGQSFERGDTIGLLLAGANRDPQIFETPHLFDASRKKNPQLSFGAGVHFCIGAPLARMEMSIAYRRMVERGFQFQVCENARFSNRYHFHGLESLILERKG